MKYALNLAEDGHILSTTYPQYAPSDAVIVDALPEGDISEYRYVDGQYIYDPLPKPDPAPSGDSVWEELDAAYTAGYQEGYTEGVNSAYDQ